MVEDVGSGVHDRPQPVIRSVEVGDQHLDAHARARLAHGEDRLGEDARSAVGEVVTGDAGDHDVLEPHRGDGLRDAARLVVVEPGRAAGLHGAEAAGPGARVAEDHDRGGALVPALPDVRAVGLLADRVELEPAQQALEFVVVVAGRQPGTDPVRVASRRDRPIRRREPGQAATTDRDRQVRAAVVRRGRGGLRRLEHRQLAGHGRSVVRTDRAPHVATDRVQPQPPLIGRRTSLADRSRDPAARTRAPWQPWPTSPRRSRPASTAGPRRDRPAGRARARNDRGSPRAHAQEDRRDLEAGQRPATEPRGHHHRVAQTHVLAAEEVRLADPAAIERRDDAGRHVIDINGRDPEVDEREVAQGAVVGALQLLADLRVIVRAIRRTRAW